MVVAGDYHTVLLRSDSTAIACGWNADGQCDLPALDAGLTYAQVAAGPSHTLLLRSDGAAVACGANSHGQCDLPCLHGGLTYAQVAAGAYHTVFLKSDGTAVACGVNFHGQCELPALHVGVTYVQVTAGHSHTVLLRSDGTAVACGSNEYGQCDLPALDGGLTYSASSSWQSPVLPTIVLQASLNEVAVCFTTLAGEQFCCFEAVATDRLVEVQAHLIRKAGSGRSRVDAVSSSGVLMSSVLRKKPSATLGDFVSIHED